MSEQGRKTGEYFSFSTPKSRQFQKYSGITRAFQGRTGINLVHLGICNH
jgi:hypothetical protein